MTSSFWNRGIAPALLYAGGVAAGCALALEAANPATGWAVALLAGGLALGRTAGGVLVFCAAGYLTAGLGSGDRPPFGSPLEARVSIRSSWVVDDSGRRARAQAHLLYWRSRDVGHRAAMEVLLDIPAEAPLPPVGSLVRTRGLLKAAQVYRNRGETSTGGSRLVVKASRWLSVETPPGHLQRWANLVRERIDAVLPGPKEHQSGGVAMARALVLGDGSGLSTETWRALRQTGLAHLAAVSGFNVAVLVTAVWVLAQLLGVSGVWRHALSGLVALSYLWVLGEQPSAARATAMAACVALAFAVKELPWAFQLIGWVGSILLLGSPSWVHDLSFQLTFAATLGLLVGTPPLAARLRSLRLSPWVATAIAACVSAQVATAPWSLIHFHSLVSLGVFWNLLAAPWAAVAFLASFLALPLLACGGWCARLTIRILDLLAEPLGWLTGWTPVWGTRSWCAGDALAWLGSAALAMALWSQLGSRVRWWLGVVGMAAWTMPSLDLGGWGASPRVIAFDVGQGDATLLEGGGARILVDGGGWEAGDFGGRVLVPALAAEGIHRLDAVVLTHFDRDHCRGLLDLTSFLPVADIWTGPGWEASDCGRALRGRAARRHGTLVADDRLRYGAWSLEVVAPHLLDLGRIGLDTNDASVVLLAEARGHRFLMLGDLEAKGERWLAYRRDQRLRAELIKVGHHGSATSTTGRLLDVVQPRFALISAGRDNAFGHPAPAVLERLQARRAMTLRTDALGQIVLEPIGRTGWRVSLPGSIGTEVGIEPLD